MPAVAGVTLIRNEATWRNKDSRSGPSRFFLVVLKVDPICQSRITFLIRSVEVSPY